jgi:hypothetical protein
MAVTAVMYSHVSQRKIRCTPVAEALIITVGT